jgi:hypothetical protein
MLFASIGHCLKQITSAALDQTRKPSFIVAREVSAANFKSSPLNGPASECKYPWGLPQRFKIRTPFLALFIISRGLVGHLPPR